jgi:hypothetical protein
MLIMSTVSMQSTRCRSAFSGPSGASQRIDLHCLVGPRGRSCHVCRAFKVFSPSKLNLFLRIVRRRDDGFHDLASLFHVIDLGDTLTLDEVEGSEDKLTCNVSDVPTDSSNLVIKALDLFRRHTGAFRPLKGSLRESSLRIAVCCAASSRSWAPRQFRGG